MDGEITHLAYATAVGAALLFLGALQFGGPKRAIELTRRLGLAGVFLSLFIGTIVQSLAVSLVEGRPYTLGFLSTRDLRVQALMEDPDLRTRYNTDSRLRYIPSSGGDTVINLESPYVMEVGPLRHVEFPVLDHSTPVPKPAGVSSLSFQGDDQALRDEVDGFYEAAKVTTGWTESPRAGLARDGSVGFLVLGIVGLVGGVIPLLARALLTGRDGLRLFKATSQRPYRGVRIRSLKAGLVGLSSHHFRESGTFASMALFGLLIGLTGILLGLAREDDTRRRAHEIFRQARYLKIEGASAKAKGPALDRLPS